MEDNLKNILKLVLDHGDIQYLVGRSMEANGILDKKLALKSVEAFKKIKETLSETLCQVTGHATNVQDTES